MLMSTIFTLFSLQTVAQHAMFRENHGNKNANVIASIITVVLYFSDPAFSVALYWLQLRTTHCISDTG